MPLNSNRYSFTFYWAKFVHDFLYYHRVYTRKLGKTPPQNTPIVIVSNHQNSLNDAMGIILTMGGRKIWFLARGDIFSGGLINKLLTFLGILPVYRERDGMANLKNNFKTFDVAEKRLLEGYPVCLYPEAKHQNRRYLGTFYLAYTRLAFEAAAQTNFETEIFILPSANHYSDYFKWQSDLLISYGEPFSLQPYYRAYQENPRKTQEDVNDIICQKVKDLMLDIQEEEYYQAIYDLLGNVGRDYALSQKINPNHLPSKLEIDRLLVEKIEQQKLSDFTNFEEICNLSNFYSQQLRQHHLEDRCFRRNPNAIVLLLSLFGLVFTFPCFVYGFLHHFIIYFLPKFISRNFKDKLLRPSIDLGMSMVLTVPILYITYFTIAFCITHDLWKTLIYYLTIAISGVFAYWWARYCSRWSKKVKTLWLSWFYAKKYRSIISTRESLKKKVFKLMRSH